MRLTPIPIDSLPSEGNVNMYKQCASARLYLPLVLPVRHMLHIDSDTLVTGSLEPLFEAMEKHAGRAIFMAEEVAADRGGSYASVTPLMSTLFPGAKTVMAGRTGYNSGVLGINVENWKEAGLNDRLDEAMRLAEKGLISSVGPGAYFGDQDLLNFICKEDLNLLYTMQCQYNVRADSRCDWNGGSPPFPVILHGNSDLFNATKLWPGVWEWEGQQGPPINMAWNATAEKILDTAAKVLAAEAIPAGSPPGLAKGELISKDVRTSDPASLWDRAGLAESDLPRLKDAQPERS